MVVEIFREELQRILAECKLQAYAGGGEKAYYDTPQGKLFLMTVADSQTHESWTFTDLFSGDAYFSGREYLTYKRGISSDPTGVWSMVYRGTVLFHAHEFPEIDQHRIFDFLREPLKAMPIDLPFRGPLGKFTSERFPGLEYTNEVLRPSDLTDGVGIEKIFRRGEEVYFGIWSGGLVLENLDDIKIV